jgi:hypothetical protein
VALVLATYNSSTGGQAPQYLTLISGLLASYNSVGAGGTILASSQFGGPIYAWRVNLTSSNLTTYVTFLQVGKKL